MFNLRSLTTPRGLCLLIFLGCLGLMAFGMFLQHVQNLEPCPLCILQRYAFIATGLIALVAFLHNSRSWGRVVYGLLMVLGAGAGAGVAARQVWLQHHPQVVAECAPGLDYMLESFPLAQVLPMLFKGEGDCSKVVWQFLGFSIPEWALLWFAIFLVMAVRIIFARTQRRY